MYSWIVGGRVSSLTKTSVATYSHNKFSVSVGTGFASNSTLLEQVSALGLIHKVADSRPVFYALCLLFGWQTWSLLQTVAVRACHQSRHLVNLALSL